MSKKIRHLPHLGKCLCNRNSNSIMLNITKKYLCNNNGVNNFSCLNKYYFVFYKKLADK